MPFFSRASRRHADVDEFLRNLGDWFATVEEISLPLLTGEILFDAVLAESPSAGGFDSVGWHDFKALSVGLIVQLQSWLLWKNLGIGLFTCLMPISS